MYHLTVFEREGLVFNGHNSFTLPVFFVYSVQHQEEGVRRRGL